VEPLHCVLLGIFIWLLQGLNCLRREKDDESSSSSSDDDDNDNRKPYHLFTGAYNDIVESDLKRIRFSLRQQCNYDMLRTYFPSGYLPDANNKDDKSTGKLLMK